TNSRATGVSVTGAYEVGGLIGRINNTTGVTIDNNFSTSNVTALNGNMVGGLAGYSAAPISNSYATGTVIAAAGGNAGGLVGQSVGNITYSYASGSVTATGDYVGGLEGGSTTNGRYLQFNFATGNVNAGTARYVGGLSGYIRTTV